MRPSPPRPCPGLSMTFGHSLGDGAKSRPFDGEAERGCDLPWSVRGSPGPAGPSAHPFPDVHGTLDCDAVQTLSPRFGGTWTWVFLASSWWGCRCWSVTHAELRASPGGGARSSAPPSEAHGPPAESEVGGQREGNPPPPSAPRPATQDTELQEHFIKLRRRRSRRTPSGAAPAVPGPAPRGRGGPVSTEAGSLCPSVPLSRVQGAGSSRAGSK